MASSLNPITTVDPMTTTQGMVQGDSPTRIPNETSAPLNMPLSGGISSALPLGLSPQYNAPFQHFAKPIPTVLYQNPQNFTTPSILANVHPLSSTLNLPPLCRDAVIDCLKTQFFILQQ